MNDTEILLNAHIHSRFSDGSGTYDQIIQAAIEAGLDAILITDHNFHVTGRERIISENGQTLHVLTGEEIHDPKSHPPKNHLLVFHSSRDLTQLAEDPQELINGVNRVGGLSFLAHPDDFANPLFKEPGLKWLDRGVVGFTGIELWNGLSELKSASKSPLTALEYLLFPNRLPHGPIPETMSYWDSLLNSGRKVSGIGGSDGHALIQRVGPFVKTIFPYSYHFSSINNHLLLPGALTGNLPQDQKLIYESLRNGNLFIANDLFVPARGFRFTASTRFEEGTMGEEIRIQGGATLQITLPQEALCQLRWNGEVVKTWKHFSHCTFITHQPGVYRVEVFLNVLGTQRFWIISNPIYIRG